MLIRKDQDILSFIKPLIESGYQVLFDNDGEDGEYYWIKVNHPHWDEARFELVSEDQYIENYKNEEKLEDLFEDYDEQPYDKCLVEDE